MWSGITTQRRSHGDYEEICLSAHGMQSMRNLPDITKGHSEESLTPGCPL